MAKKTKVAYFCSECGTETNGWMGQCPACGSWGTIVEHKVQPTREADSRRRTGTASGRGATPGTQNGAPGIGLTAGYSGNVPTPVKLKNVGTGNYSRISTGIGEFDRVLGSGMVLGSLVLISGEPGIGKSTLIIQAANNIAKEYGTVLYVSGEESEEQIKIRADRVCNGISDNLMIFSETNLEDILATGENTKPCFIVIDSIQTMYSEEMDNIAGSITQIRACSNLLMNYAKMNNVPIFIVAHVNKSGDLAGPKTIEHMVDCVLSFTGERDGDFRVLRSLKNRFGTTDEIGAFRMCREGLIEEKDLSASLLENPDIREEGSVVSAIYEGSRPVFFEIQALVVPANVGYARRTSVGIDYNRLNMILAVLEKKAGLSLLNYDVYVNVVGGMKPDSPSTDLAVALAIYSSYREQVGASKIVALGEVGLTGNLRSARNADKIAQEAVRLGYETIIVPSKNSSLKVPGISVVPASNVLDAIRAFTGR